MNRIVVGFDSLDGFASGVRMAVELDRSYEVPDDIIRARLRAIVAYCAKATPDERERETCLEIFDQIIKTAME